MQEIISTVAAVIIYVAGSCLTKSLVDKYGSGEISTVETLSYIIGLLLSATVALFTFISILSFMELLTLVVETLG